MIKIFDVETARRSILKRVPLSLMEYPEAVLARTQRLFGPGVTPPQAVNQILMSIHRMQPLPNWETSLPPSKLAARFTRSERLTAHAAAADFRVGV
jgi:hypothetical protein